MSRHLPFWLRFALALAVTLAFFKLYAGWHWRTTFRSGRGVFAFSATGSYYRRESVHSILLDGLIDAYRAGFPRRPLERAIWPGLFAFVTVFPAALVAAGVYAVITARFGPPSPDPSECRCRKCGHILHGLSEPRCPECGEAV